MLDAETNDENVAATKEQLLREILKNVGPSQEGNKDTQNHLEVLLRNKLLQPGSTVHPRKATRTKKKPQQPIRCTQDARLYGNHAVKKDPGDRGYERGEKSGSRHRVDRQMEDSYAKRSMMAPPPIPYVPPMIPTTKASRNIPTVLKENRCPQNSYSTRLKFQEMVLTIASGGSPAERLPLPADLLVE